MIHDVYLKPLLEEDIPMLLQWMEQEDILQFFGDPLVWISEIRQNLINPEWIFHFLAITTRPIGFCQFYDTKKAPQGLWSHEEEPTAGIDFFLAEEEFRGQGLGKAMLLELLDFIHKTNNYEYVLADVDEHNNRAEAFLCSIGFKDYKKGLLRFHLKDLKHGV